MQIEKVLGLEGRLSTLVAAADWTQRALAQITGRLHEMVPPDDLPLDVVVLGSLGRREASRQSDMDYLVLAHGLPSSVKQTRQLLGAVEALRVELSFGEPGVTGMFGEVVAAPDLTERIGLEGDTNESHSRRILLLEESVSVFKPNLHDGLLAAILERYLADYPEPKKGVPRFLLNDILRYWRTISVDYQAKRWRQPGDEKWGLRYLKLLISRKLGFAGTLTSLFLCEEATVPYFQEQFRQAPLERLAQLAPHLTEDATMDALREVFLIAENFAAALGDDNFRREVRSITSPYDVTETSAFAEMRDDGRRLQKCLEVVFFDSSCLRDQSRAYLSF
jgi:hypothetical protein